MKRPLTYIGHHILREKAQLVSVIDEAIQELINDMKETLLALSHAVALAAPQIGVPLAIFVTRELTNPHDITSHSNQRRVYINPHIDQISNESWIEEEGCLSIPDLYRPVERPRDIVLTFQVETGAYHTESYTGWMAKIIMHENDHLHGSFFVDRLSKQEKKRISSTLDTIKRSFATHNSKLKTWPFYSDAKSS